MRTLKTLTFLLFITLFASCDENNPIVLDPVESETVTNLHAPQEGGQGQPVSGTFTLFDFETGTETTDENAWDIGFRGTSIIVNGGVSLGTNGEPDRTGNAALYFRAGGFASVVEVNETALVQDSSNRYAISAGESNWYSYSGPPNHTITPVTGGVIVVRTTEGRYAKLEIVSYYQDNPDPIISSSVSRYYTFNYVYNPNEGETSFE